MGRRFSWVLGPLELGLLSLACSGLAIGGQAGQTVARSAGMLLLGWVSAKGLARWFLADVGSPGITSLASLVVGYGLVVWSQIGSSWVGFLFCPAGQWSLWVLLALAGLALGASTGQGTGHDSKDQGSCTNEPGFSSRSIGSRLAGLSGRLIVGCASLYVLFMVLGRWGSPPLEWDAMSYHLYFPVQWIHAGRIEYVPTPFGPDFITYFPCNFECFVLWLYWPAMSEWLPKTAGLPFVVWCAVALAAWIGLLAGSNERRGATVRLAASLVVAIWLATRAVVIKGTGTDNDLAGAACFLTSLVLCESACQTPSRRLWLLSGLSAGLMAGTKYPNLVFLGILLVCVFPRIVTMASPAQVGTRRLPGRRDCWPLVAPCLRWLAGVLAGGGYWYLRNWLATGNPLYPARLDLVGMELFRGPLARSAMYEGGWTHPERSLAGLYQVLRDYLGAITLPGWDTPVPIVWLLIASGLVGGSLLLGRRGAWTRARWTTVIVPPTGLLLFWWLIPYTTEPRYASGAIQVMFAWMGLAVCLAGRVGGALLLGGYLFFLSGQMAPLIEGWGAVTRPRPQMGQRIRQAIAAPFDVRAQWDEAVIGATLWDRDVEEGWKVAARLTDGQPETVAYVGHNHPYRLFGPDLANRVLYVPVNPHPTWQLHDYVEHLGPERVAEYVVRDRVPVYRVGPSRDAWVGNLRDSRVGLVFITTIHPGERHAFVREMDQRGYSIEERWARELGFPVLASGAEYRLYRVRLDEPPTERRNSRSAPLLPDPSGEGGRLPASLVPVEDDAAPLGEVEPSGFRVGFERKPGTTGLVGRDLGDELRNRLDRMVRTIPRGTGVDLLADPQDFESDRLAVDLEGLAGQRGRHAGDPDRCQGRNQQDSGDSQDPSPTTSEGDRVLNHCGAACRG